MRKEIVLPAHLYDRIKASAGEHGGIGFGHFFVNGEPLCAHGHAWGTEERQFSASVGTFMGFLEPELARHLTASENDEAVAPWWTQIIGVLLQRSPREHRISFAKWCKRLNVKRGEDVPRETPAERQTEMATV